MGNTHCGGGSLCWYVGSHFGQSIGGSLAMIADVVVFFEEKLGNVGRRGIG